MSLPTPAVAPRAHSILASLVVRPAVVRRAGATVFVVALLAAIVGCSRGDAARAQPGADTAGWAAKQKAGAALGAGLYVFRSAARHRGDTLRLVDESGTRYSAQLVPPGRPGELFSGRVSVREDGRVDVRLACMLCPVGRDPGGMPTYDVVTYNGVFATRALGGDRIELRQVDSAAVDTLERVR